MKPRAQPRRSLPSELSEDETYRKRLEREAKTIPQLQHPHVCAVYDIGAEGGTRYLVMEYLEGETLEERLKKSPLPIDQVLRIGGEIAEAIEAAHQRGTLPTKVRNLGSRVRRNVALWSRVPIPVNLTS